MEYRKKTNSEYIIDALRFNKDLRSPEITEKVSELSGRKMKIQDIASILAKLSNSEKCDLGFFVQKKKTPKGYTYNLVPELFEIDFEQVYDLTRKTGKNRFTLEEALEKNPGLKKYVKASRLKQASPRKADKRCRNRQAGQNAQNHGRHQVLRQCLADASGGVVQGGNNRGPGHQREREYPV